MGGIRLYFKLPHWRSLKTRVTLFTLGIFLVSLWLLAFYADRILRTDMQHMLGDQQLSTATFVAANVNDDLLDRLSALELFAQALDPALLGNAANLQTRLEQHPILLRLFNNGVVILNLDGTVIADMPSSAARIGVNLMDRDYVATAIRDGESTVGQPVLAKKLGVPSLGMAVPVRDTQGKIIGAVAGLTRLDTPNFLDSISRS